MTSGGKLIWSFLRLVRAKNLLIIAFTQYLVYWSLLTPYGIPVALSPIQFFLLVLSTVLIAAGGYVINDYMDVRTDEINYGKVIVGPVIRRRAAIAWHLGLTFVGVALGMYLVWILQIWYLSVFHLFPAWFLWLYSATLKRQFLIGNLLVSAFAGGVVLTVGMHQILPALDGSYINTQRTLFMIICGYALFVFLMNLIREVVKDLEDVPGDSAQGFKTMPIQIGETGTRVMLSALIAAMLVMVGIVCYKFLIESIGPLVYTIVLVILPGVLLLYQVVTVRSAKDYSRANMLTRVIMLFGILSMWAFHQLANL